MLQVLDERERQGNHHEAHMENQVIFPYIHGRAAGKRGDRTVILLYAPLLCSLHLLNASREDRIPAMAPSSSSSSIPPGGVMDRLGIARKYEAEAVELFRAQYGEDPCTAHEISHCGLHFLRFLPMQAQFLLVRLQKLILPGQLP